MREWDFGSDRCKKLVGHYKVCGAPVFSNNVTIQERCWDHVVEHHLVAPNGMVRIHMRDLT